METVQGGYRGKLKKENEDDDVAGDGERDIEEDWINGDRRARRKDNTRNGGRRRTDRVVSGPAAPISWMFLIFVVRPPRKNRVGFRLILQTGKS